MSSLCDWLLSLTIMLLRLIYAVVCISTSFFLKGELYSIVWISRILFIQSPDDELLPTFAIVNNPTVNIGIQISL